MPSAKLQLSQDVKPLSKREQEVFVLIRRGLAYKAIAALLGIALRTVECHAETLCHKLGMSRLEIIAGEMAELREKAAAFDWLAQHAVEVTTAQTYLFKCVPGAMLSLLQRIQTMPTFKSV